MKHLVQDYKQIFEDKGIDEEDAKKLIDFANAYNVKSIELLKVYNVPEMKFTSFRKKYVG